VPGAVIVTADQLRTSKGSGINQVDSRRSMSVYLFISFCDRNSGLKVIRLGGGYQNLTEAFVRNINKIYWLLLLLDIVVGLAISKQYTQKFSDTVVGTEVVGQ
jgi:hypothetical protein